MNLIVHFCIIILMFSCSIKKEDENKLEEKRGLHQILPDDDGDGLSNSLEKENGLSVTEPDFPIVNIEKISLFKFIDNQSSKEIIGAEPSSQRFSENKYGVRSSFLKDRFNRGMLNHLNNGVPYNKDFIEDIWENLAVFKISKWNTYEYLKLFEEGFHSPETVDLYIELSLNLQNILHVSLVKDVILEVGYINNDSLEFESLAPSFLISSMGEPASFSLDGKVNNLSLLKRHSLRIRNLDFSEIEELIKNQAQFVIKVNDFKYIKLGEKLLYSSVISKVKGRNRTLIVSDPQGSKVIASSSKKSIKEILELDGLSYTSSELGDITSLNTNGKEFKNSLISSTINVYKILNERKSEGLWLTSPMYLKDDEILSNGRSYSLSYSTVLDSRNSIYSIRDEEIPLVEDKDIEIDNVLAGDKFVFTISYKKGIKKVSNRRNKNLKSSFEMFACGPARQHLEGQRECGYRKINTPCGVHWREVESAIVDFNLEGRQIEDHLTFKFVPKGNYHSIDDPSSQEIDQEYVKSNSIVSGNKLTILINSLDFIKDDNYKLIVSSSKSKTGRSLSYGFDGYQNCSQKDKGINFKCPDCKVHKSYFEDKSLIQMKFKHITSAR